MENPSPKFNECAFELIDKLEERVDTEEDAANIDRLRKRLNILLREDEDAAIDGAHRILIEFEDKIARRDEHFFTTMDYRAEYSKRSKDPISKSDEFIFSLIDVAKIVYTNSPKNVKDFVYEKVRSLLESSYEWALLLKKREISAMLMASR